MRPPPPPTAPDRADLGSTERPGTIDASPALPARPRRRRLRWRPLTRAVHRDVGYFMTALVLIYAISGVAVNHIDSWNPSYAIENRPVDLGPLPGRDLPALQAEVVRRLGLEPASVKGHHLQSADQFVVFLDRGGDVKLQLSTGKGVLKTVRARTGLMEMNVLHLNHLKGAWTWFADGVGVLLALLALTGLFMLGGGKGLMGRGKWWVLAGALVPVVFVVLYHAGR